MKYQSLSCLGMLSFALAAPSIFSTEQARQWNFTNVSLFTFPTSPGLVRQNIVNVTQIPSSKSLSWYPCYDGFFCSMLDVPLDYNKPAGHRAFVPIIKYPATTKPYKGMVLSNPGGPGAPGVKFLLKSGQAISKVVGTNYDFVSWEPRGVGYSVPAANCVEDQILSRGLQSRINGPDFPILSASYIERSISNGELCKNAIGGDDQAGPHMTTAITAKDMISILDAFAASKEGRSLKGDPSLLNYWGFSYGTFLGQTFASMFPNRVGQMVLDAVLNPDDFRAGSWLSAVTDSDRAFSSFFNYCNLAGPSKCPFYIGKTPEDISGRFQSILAKLDPGLAGPNNQTYHDALVLGLNQLSFLLFAATYDSINGFPWVASFLMTLESVVAEGVTYDSILTWSWDASATSPTLGEGSINQQFWGLGVQCSDRDKPYSGNTSTQEIISRLEPLVEELKVKSWLGYSGGSGGYVGCAGWQIRSNDVFKGKFGGRTKNPILFASATLDPITPVSNAQNSARLFKNAEVLTVEAVSHSVYTSNNTCGLKKINTYFQTGKLPGKQNHCASEPGPWGVTIKSLLK